MLSCRPGAGQQSAREKRGSTLPAGAAGARRQVDDHPVKRASRPVPCSPGPSRGNVSVSASARSVPAPSHRPRPQGAPGPPFPQGAVPRRRRKIMLSLVDPRPTHTCQGYSRREFLRIGSLSLLGGLALPGLLRARAGALSAGQAVKDRSVVLLFLQGGPSHIEFFDPKMSAPEDVRSITGEVQTKLPGVTFGGTFARMGRLAD